MTEYRPVYWGQGAFLTPQHLQQQDAFHLSTQRYLWRRARSHGWGIGKLVLREEGLAAGMVEILECELLTREGVFIRGGSQSTGANAKILPRLLPETVQATTQPVSLYFAIQRAGFIGNNGSAEPSFDGRGTLPPRYALHSENQPDLYDEEAQDAELVFVETLVSIVCSLDPAFSVISQSGELVKFAEVIAAPPAGVRPSATYIPPSLDIGASPVLLKLLKNLRDLLISKAAEFSAMKRQRGVRGSASGPQEVVRTLILGKLSHYVPILQHVLEELDVHPVDAYLLLREMVGELSAFSEDFNFLGARSAGERGLPPYDHEDLRGRFAAAFALIEPAVRLLMPGPQTGIRLVYDGRFYKADLPAEILDNEANRYYIVIESEVRGEELWARLQKTGKACTMEEMDRLLKSLLFGLKIQLLAVPPEELPQKGGNLSYFMVDTKDPVWGMVRQRRNLAMKCDLNPEDTVITLVTVKAE